MKTKLNKKFLYSSFLSLVLSAYFAIIADNANSKITNNINNSFMFYNNLTISYLSNIKNSLNNHISYSINADTSHQLASDSVLGSLNHSNYSYLHHRTTNLELLISSTTSKTIQSDYFIARQKDILIMIENRVSPNEIYDSILLLESEITKLTVEVLNTYNSRSKIQTYLSFAFLVISNFLATLSAIKSL